MCWPLTMLLYCFQASHIYMYMDIVDLLGDILTNEIEINV